MKYVYTSVQGKGPLDDDKFLSCDDAESATAPLIALSLLFGNSLSMVALLNDFESSLYFSFNGRTRFPPPPWMTGAIRMLPELDD